MNTGPALSPPAKREVSKFDVFNLKRTQKAKRRHQEVAGVFPGARSFLIRGGNDGHRNLTKAVDTGHPVFIERRVNNAVMSRRMIKTMLISNYTDVRKVAEEYQGAKFVLLSGSGCTEASP